MLAVIGYHTGSHVRGGFLGVDVFFVLSGYLITSLLLVERRATGRIDLSSFWARRARRLLPAVLLLVAAVAFMTWHSEPLITFAARRADILAAVFYYANWHFIATDQSYFAVVIGQSPLVHTWSLAIEEQFYLLWPLTLLAIVVLCRDRLRRLLVVLIFGVIASALWMAVAYDPSAPTRVYFATGTRAHELLIGAALAMVVLSGGRAVSTAHRLRRVLFWSWPAVALVIAVALLKTSDQDSFYYYGGSVAFALLVALGLWIVETAPHSIPARLLGFAPLAWVGTISYGLYLWHWPVIQWVSDSHRFTDPRAAQLTEIGLTFVVATASYYAVERPIRTGRTPWLRMSVGRLAIAAPVAIGLVVLGVLRATAVPESVRVANELQANLDKPNCPAGSPEPVRDYRWCVRTEPTSRSAPIVATVGDSTVQALEPGMEQFARAHGWGYLEAGKNRCTILPLVFPSDAADKSAIAFARSCIPAIQTMFEDARKVRHPDVWMISDRWMLLPLLTADGTVVQPGDPLHDTLVSRALTSRLADVTSHGEKAVIVVIPPLGPPAECGAGRSATAGCTSPAFSIRDRATARARQIVQRAAAQSNGSVVAVDIDDVVCPGGTCPATIDGKLVRYDGIHFTEDFSRKIVPYIVTRAEQAGVRFTHDR